MTREECLAEAAASGILVENAIGWGIRAAPPHYKAHAIIGGAALNTAAIAYSSIGMIDCSDLPSEDDLNQCASDE